MMRDEALHEAAARPAGRRWYVVQSQPHKETRAALNLERQGFGVFLPRYQKTIRHARRRHERLVPLFPRYLFVSLDLGRERWRSVFGTFGVSRLVTEGFWPAPVPDGLVEDMIAAIEALGTVDLRPALTPGGGVRFLTGPFAETIGTLLDLDDAGRARVLIEILGSSREVSASAAALAPAADWGGRP